MIEDAKNEDGVFIIYDKDNGKFINGFRDKNGITDYPDWKLTVVEYSYKFVTNLIYYLKTTTLLIFGMKSS